MKLLSVLRARAIWLFPTTDLNPSGKFMLPLIGELIKRYKFVNVPNIAEALRKNEGILLTQGALSYGDTGEISADLSIYNDGLIGDTRTSTDASDALVLDVLKWAQESYGLKSPQTIRKQYISEVYMHSEKPLSYLNPKLGNLAKRISQNLQIIGDVQYELAGINFAAEQKGVSAPPLFRFERADGSPFSANRYYSITGATTSQHLELLEELERVLAG